MYNFILPIFGTGKRKIIIIIIMALQPFFGPWALFSVS
jgi:hypothetical protein